MAVSILGRKLRLNKAFNFFQQIRTGYIVLLPEIDPELLEKNPLYKNGLPNVENLSQENCLSTLGKHLMDLERSVKEIETQIIENELEIDLFEDIVEPLEENSARLEASWGLVKALFLTDNSIMPRKSYLMLHERARKARSSKYTSKHIYNMFKKCDVSSLTEEEQRVVSKFLVEGKLNGLDLEPDKRDHFREISVALANEKDKFRKRVQISNNKFCHTIHDPIVTRDFPTNLLTAMSQNKNDYMRGPWDVTLGANISNPFLAYCPDRNMRWNVWQAQRELCSGQSGQPIELSNSQPLEKIRSLRRDLAMLLGYETYAHMSMETKMVDSVEVVQTTLEKILEKARLLQEKELNELQKFASELGFTGTLEMWDIPYWERKQKISLFNWDERKIPDYFPLEKVLDGIMNLCLTIFGLRFELAKNHKSWHTDVRLYYIFEGDSPKPVAGIYIDPYSRENKLSFGTSSGFMIGIRPASRALGPNAPLAALVFNFPQPQSTKEPCLLDFTSVENLIKKFGQALQQVLSNVNYSEVSGLSNVEWDAVEIVGNFMSLWLNDSDLLKEISGHFETNEPLPSADIQQIRNHMVGYHLCEEIYLANLDLQLHTSKLFWAQIVKDLWPRHFLFDYNVTDTHPLSFTASISGELSAAYFTKLWARMLAVDAYATFKNESDKAAIGTRFRDTFLGFGGACHPSEIFRRFQGRDVTANTFLESLTS